MALPPTVGGAVRSQGFVASASINASSAGGVDVISELSLDSRGLGRHNCVKRSYIHLSKPAGVIRISKTKAVKSIICIL